MNTAIILGGFFFFVMIIFIGGMFLMPELFGISKNESNENSSQDYPEKTDQKSE